MADKASVNASVAVLEDSPVHAAIYRSALSQGGYRCEVSGTVKEFLTRCAGEHYDLYLLDWELPDGTAAEVIRWARARKGPRPGIVVASLHTEEDKVVEALAMGADDFVFKPVRVQELLARLAAHLRRGQPSSPETSELEPYTIDHGQRQLLHEGQVLPLTDKEFDLLETLYRQKEQLVTRQALLADVWGVTADVDTRTVDAHVSRLRRKLGLGNTSPWTIASAYGHGYRLTRLAT